MTQHHRRSLVPGPFAPKSRRRRRALQIEGLEDRCYPSAEAVASLVSPDWFQDFGGTGSLRHAGAGSWSAAGASSDQLASVSGQADVYDWIVRFNTAAVSGIASAAGTASLLSGGGVQFEVLCGLGLVGQVLVRSSGASAETARTVLARNARVASFEMDVVQDFAAAPNDPQFSNLWGMENTGQTGGVAGADIDAPAAWNISTGSRNVVVGIIDTGVDYTHPDLAANIWTNPGEIAGNGVDDDGNGFVDDVHGYDFANNDGDPMDDNSHGTHVAGTIAGAGNNGRGVTGVNWTSSVMALKFLSGNGSGYTSDAVRAINYATMMRSQYGINVRVLNNSWGGGGSSAALGDAIRASGDAGILFVAAAGNSGRNNDATPNYPSNYDSPNVIAVAATDSSDVLASFSNYGAASVDLAAPGVSIYSTVPGGRYASYSGTSMATPHVAGVAALAWAAAPDATVAQVRDAILQGVDRLSSLTGKVASSGRLNALRTLQLLAAPGPQAPVVASLSVNPSPVVAGAPVTLTAQGVSDADGSVSGVSFYLDSNSNGQWDANDRLLGTTGSIVGQQASLTLNTAGYAPGQRLVFARAVDDQSHWSQAATATLNVLGADDHGNDAATATRASVGLTAAGVIDHGGDRDWFAVNLVAGRSYVFETELRGLVDSVLTLYGPDGATVLSWDDDGGPGLASRITWTARQSGTHYLEVRAYSSAQTGDYALRLAGQNAAPQLYPVGRRWMSHGQDTLTVALRAVDADRDPLTYSAVVYTLDPMFTEQAVPGLTLSIAGNRVTIDPPAGFQGTLYVRATVSDGQVSDTQTFEVRVINSAPRLAAIPSQVISGGQDLRLVLAATDRDGDPLTFTARFQTLDPIAQRAYTLDRQFAFDYAGSYFENFAGAQERYVLAGDSTWYYLLPNGELHRWTGTLGASPLVARLTPDYYASPALLHDAPRPIASVRASDVTLDLQGNMLTIHPRAGLTGSFCVIVRVSDGRTSGQQMFQVSVGASGTVAAAQSTPIETYSLDPVAAASEGIDRIVDYLARSEEFLELASFANQERSHCTTDATEGRAVRAIDNRLELVQQLADELAARRSGASEGRSLLSGTWSASFFQEADPIAGHAEHDRDSASGSDDLDSQVLDELYGMLDELEADVFRAE